MDWGSVDYSLTRFTFQRLLAFIYFIGFLIAVNQFQGLSGSHGLLPVKLFVKKIDFWDSPSIFWFYNQDFFLIGMAWLGLGLSIAALAGLTDLFATWVSMLSWLLLWLIYLSFVNVGQTFYGFGWETLLLETGFLAIFLGPIKAPAPVIVIWLLRWVLFRLMFGAGLIKLRGDPCWRDLTCLKYHYETQPSPNPLSWYFHHLPLWVHRGGVVFNHFVELIVPFGYFGPRPLRIAAGLITIVFQSMLIFSGNLSWLNVITIVICFSCFDDRFLSMAWGSLAAQLPATAAVGGLPMPLIYMLAALVLFLSIKPVQNLLSPGQAMNTSFEPLHLVNTYGAFGSVTKVRTELTIEGSLDAAGDPQATWLEYGFKAKPGDILRRPPQVTPYHYKLDWQMWFAAMSPYYQNPWLLNLVGKLLQGEPEVLGLLRENPFPESPPKFIRINLWKYSFTDFGEKAWWKRELVGEYLPPLSLQEPQFRQVLIDQGWLDPADSSRQK
jgi:hypothetical protein